MSAYTAVNRKSLWSLFQDGGLHIVHENLFIFGNCFVLLRVTVDLKPILGTMGTSPNAPCFIYSPKVLKNTPYFLFLFVCQVFLAECVGPLFIYLMFYFRLPFIYAPKYDFTTSKHWVVQ